MNSPIQWFLLLLCDRRTAPTLFSTLAWYPPVGGTRRIGKDSPVHRPDGLRPSRRRITACDQRFEGYPSMLACYIRRAAGTHEYLYYDSSGQRRAGPQLTGLGTSCAPVLFLSSQRNIPMRRKTHTQLFSQRNIPGNGVIGQNVCPFWLVFLCGSGRFSCSSCMGGELEVGQNVCPEWPVRPCGTTVE